VPVRVLQRLGRQAEFRGDRAARRSRGQVRAGRPACQDHCRRVGAVRRSVLADPSHHTLDVDHSVAIRGAWRKAVVRAHTYPTVAREPVQQRPGAEHLAADAEPAAVQVDQHGRALRRASAGVHVEEVTAPGFAVAEVAEPSHVGAVRDHREEQHADQRDARATQHRGLRAVIAKSLAERRPQGGACGARADGKRDEDGHGYGHRTDREPPQRHAGIAPGQRCHGAGRQPVKAEERLLVDQVAEGELHVPWA